MRQTRNRTTGKAVMIRTISFLSILTIGLLIGLSSGFIKDFFIEQKNEKAKEEAITVYRENRDVKTEADKAEEGEALAQLHLALSYALGEGMEKDESQAYQWMEKAAQQELADAQYLLAEMLLQEIGTDQDTYTAAKYMKQAAENDCIAAKQMYAQFAFVGEGGYQDYEVSYPIFLEYREQNPDYMYALGVMNYYGMGTPINYNLAKICFEQAKEDGIEEANDYLKDVTPRANGKKESFPESASVEENTTDVDYGTDYPDMSDLIEQYAEQLQGGGHYEAFRTELDAMHGTNPDVAATLTLFGKDNWLFFQNQADGQAYHDYVGDNAFSDLELENIKNHLLEQKKQVEDAGAEYVCMIVPNKEIVYSEKMPSYIERVSTTTRTDLLVEYLRKETDIDIIYCKETFEDKKDQYPLYYSSDTHWTMVGSYLALSDLMKMQYNKEIAFDMDMFTIPTPDYAGDLSVILQREDRYHDEVYNLPEEQVREEDCVDQKLLLIGDSFGEFLNMEAKHFFQGGVDSVEIGNYNYQFSPALNEHLTADEPDLVVVECVERYIERLAK